MKQTSTLRRIISAPEFGPFVLLILEIAVFAAINPAFLSPLNISNTLTFTVELGLIALAMTLLMTAGEFDLSVGSVFGFLTVLMGFLVARNGVDPWLAMLAVIVVGLAIGAMNGAITTRLNIPSFIVKPGDEISVRESSKTNPTILSSRDATAHAPSPSWMDVDRENLKGRINSTPRRDELVQIPINEQLIVELYSK